MKNADDTPKNEPENGHGFVLDTNNFIQVGETRFFEITGSKESLDKFLKDNDLFKGGV